ncbi:50S ribosomal protein L11 methyltransferase [Kineosporia sp. A_224]|uniref:class I SAM-dependent methyltransferase n=1 Tax=Kineosporia sp. A_224 TaxID=1962180 RepID=UPI000B4A8D12
MPHRTHDPAAPDHEGPDDATAFVRALTRPCATPFVPEVVLHVAAEPYGLWQATEDRSGVQGAPPPFWAFPWPGGAALARHLLEAPDAVAGRLVVDLGCGSGLVSIAAALAGAAHVLALDLDPLALTATALNAGLNGVTVGAPPAGRLATAVADVVAMAQAADGDPLVARLLAADVVLAGDLFFERSLAAATLTVLRRAVAAGAVVLAGDPGRTYLPPDTFTPVAAFDVPVAAALEDAPVRRTRVLTLPPTG